MSIVTKTGDKGETGLFGSARTAKTDPRIVAIGDTDELNAALGCAVADASLPDDVRHGLIQIQNRLFTLGADLATLEGSNPNAKRVTADHVQELETWITTLEASLPPLTAFILPGGHATGAYLHLARAICRRAERSVVALSKADDLNPQIQIYLNRLSDLLFLLAREVNGKAGVEEVKVTYK